MALLLATISSSNTGSFSVPKPLTRPPASRTSSTPAATSQALSPYS